MEMELTQEKTNRIVDKIIDVLVSEEVKLKEADDILYSVKRLINKPVSAAVQTELDKVVNKELASGN